MDPGEIISDPLRCEWQFKYQGCYSATIVLYSSGKCMCHDKTSHSFLMISNSASADNVFTLMYINIHHYSEILLNGRIFRKRCVMIVLLIDGIVVKQTDEFVYMCFTVFESAYDMLYR